MKRGFLALAFVLGGCSELHPPRVGEPIPTAPESSEESAYQSALARASSHAEVYGGFDTRLFAAATFETARFREARVRRQAAFQHRTRDWLGAAIEQELREAEQSDEFTLGVHFNESHYEDFDKPGSIWSLVLATSAGEVTPLEIRRIGKGDLNLSAYYPYLDAFWTAYRLRFPRRLANGGELMPPGTDKVTLRLASSLGKAEMNFPVP